MFTPFELSILLHYHVSPVSHPSLGCLIWDETIDKLKRLDLIKYNDDIAVLDPDTFQLTERGHCYVREGLCRLPIPERVWVIPANTEALK